MEYIKRDIVDRIAVGDDCFRMEKLSDGRYRLIPAPDSVVEAGTNIDRNLLQPMEDAIYELVNNSEHPVPTPTVEDVGKVIKVQADGAYGLAEDEAGISEVPADIVTAGTLAGQVQANADATAIVNVAQLRNISAGMEDLTAGSSALADGEVYLVYE